MRVTRLINLIIVLCLLAGCDFGPRKRPYGYIKLGKAANFTAERKFLADKRLLLRRDEGGFYVMSTLCTYDLSPLWPQKTEGGIILRTEFNDSRYDLDGKVLHGPASAGLPYYELRLEPEAIGGPKDTLYAHIGREMPATWRLKVEQEEVPVEE